MVLAVLGIVLVLGMITLPPAPVAEAGSNGQQLSFKPISGSIKWIRVYGRNQNGQAVSFYREFNPPINELRLSNWWWIGQGHVEYSIAPGNTYNGCYIDVPRNQSSNWVTVELNVKASYPGCRQR
ncbi:MAG TPA: hypothetical protein PLS49_00885 [Candidatus Woesebacteria bacterium]|nr:hypothetical protein [Candidatus Woesebacteria bacterium]